MDIQDKKGICELAAKYVMEDLKRGPELSSPEATKDFIKLHLYAEPHEKFIVIFMDTRHRVICHEDLFQGTIDGATVYPRVVATRALFNQAAAIIVAHNHPSGIAEPSQADLFITKRLKDALALLDIRLLDHFVVDGAGEMISMAQRGLI